jgi:uncharacterized protein (DUF1800 family)
MTLVWHGHFATSHEKVDDVRLMHAQNELLRAHALGDFRALLHAIARDPAMLVWLDGDSNRRGHPNENFARELLELFALGDGNYDEHDVQEAARAFTGRGTAGRVYAFRPEHYDDGEKTILGRTGRWDGDEALEIVLEHPACARRLARVLLAAFVAPEPDEEWVAVLAQFVRDADWDVGRVLDVLLRSRLFFSPAARRSRIAGPVELVAVAARAIGATPAPKRAAELGAAMGQALFRPPSVKGWDGGRAWIHSGHWIARHNGLVELARAAQDAGGETEELLSGLLPEGSSAHSSALERLATDAGETRVAARALVLTSPEFQLF